MDKFRALRITEEDGEYQAAVQMVDESVLAEGDVTIRVHYSALNYKDMLAIEGSKGVAKTYPHTPGIDCAGVVLASNDASVAVGEEVLVTGYALGMAVPGGFSQVVRVPAQWVIKRPVSLSLFETMAYGTAGVTAAMCVDSLVQVGITPEFGDVLVTGATGSVGSLAVMLLHKLGYRTVAMTGKSDAQAYLRDLGADEVIERADLSEPVKKGLLSERWGGAIDTVGGDILMNVLKSIKYGGSVACCGLAASPYFEGSVFPFILRGVNLLGVDSAELPREFREMIWGHLAEAWRLPNLESVVKKVGLEEVLEAAAQMRAGTLIGRVVVDLND